MKIFVNELSFQNLEVGFEVNKPLSDFCEMVEKFFKHRNDIVLCVPSGLDCNGEPVHLKFKGAIENRDRYRLFLNRLKYLEPDDSLSDREVLVNDQPCVGLNHSDFLQSWSLSLITPSSSWKMNSIPATLRRICAEKGELIDSSINVRHSSLLQHLDLEWETKVRDWGYEIASSSVIHHLNGFRVVMYSGPKEHNPPHVHLLKNGSKATVAKYEIERFIRKIGPPTWDAEMKQWINENRAKLLQSWTRCQTGGFPYK